MKPAFAMLASLVMVGCVGRPEADLDSADPGARVRAALDVDASGRDDEFRDLVRMLGSDDPLERMVASSRLSQIAGDTMGYHHASPEAERLSAAERWASWARDRGAEAGVKQSDEHP